MAGGFGGGGRPPRSDWICIACKGQNFARRTQVGFGLSLGLGLGLRLGSGLRVGLEGWA